MEEINEVLEEQIRDKLEELNSTHDSSKRKELISEIERLCEMRNEDLKLMNELDETKYRRQLDDEKEVAETEFKRQQFKEQKKERIFRSCLSVAGFLGSVWLACVGFCFEENGTFRSDTFKWIRSGFKFHRDW